MKNIAFEMKGRARVYVSGRVQGVFFRSEIQDEALRRDVAGWVRNLPDGRVEAIFEGDIKNVERIIEFCRKGPPLAKVTNIEVSWEAYTGEFKDFRIRRGDI